MSLALDKCHKRWYELKHIPVYDDLWNAVANGIRFPLVTAGRRSGKTEKAKRFIAKQAMKNPNETYFVAAPTREQAKKIFWKDLKLLTFSPTHARQPSETELIIYLPNGTEIHVLGLDKPQRIEGKNWTGGVIDEIADVKGEAVNANIMPALDTFDPSRPDYKVWCWFTGVPDGLNHYYDMCQKAETGETTDSKVFYWKSAEVLAPDVIEAAKKRLSKMEFKQEYEASFETATGRVYSDYSKLNYTSEEIKPHEQLCWMHDQNYTPLSSAVGVRRGDSLDELYLLDEIVLESAVSRQSAMEFVDKFKDHDNKHVLIYGDPAGKAGEKHSQESAYTQIEEVLRLNGWRWTRRLKNAHPPIVDRQNDVRAMIQNAAGEVRLFVNTSKAPTVHKGLATTTLKKGSTFQEEESYGQHITTAIGYMVNYEYSRNKPFIGRLK